MNDYKELLGDIGDCLLAHPSETVSKIMLGRAADAIEQLVKERDAALADVPKCCLYCSKQIECEMPCVYPDSECKEFEWRGVTE